VLRAETLDDWTLSDTRFVLIDAGQWSGGLIGVCSITVMILYRPSMIFVIIGIVLKIQKKIAFIAHK
jgi:hypothetical protein